MIAATAILITIMPALRRSLQGARPSAPRVPTGTEPSEPQEAAVLADEGSAGPEPTSAGPNERQSLIALPDERQSLIAGPEERQSFPAGPDERQSFLQRALERPVPGRWGRGQGFAVSRRPHEREDHRPSDAGQIDESEMERQVREQLYGPGFRRR